MKVIPLTKGKVALVDDCDYEIVKKYKWYTKIDSRNFYAVTNLYHNDKHTILKMHRLLMGLIPDDPREVDHRNHNGLDNRRENLRICNRAQNNRNQIKHSQESTSQYKGVSWNKRNKRWQAHIGFEGKRIMLGCFKDEVVAAKKYDVAAVKYFGDFANTNFPIEKYAHEDIID